MHFAFVMTTIIITSRYFFKLLFQQNGCKYQIIIVKKKKKKEMDEFVYNYKKLAKDYSLMTHENINLQREIKHLKYKIESKSNSYENVKIKKYVL